jgi:hypothetical protein
MGAVGVKRLAASANHSSEKERTLPPRAEDIKSGEEQSVYARDSGVIDGEGRPGEYV